MTLLLQCLRDLRTRSGDPDLLPQAVGGSPPGVGHLPRNGDEQDDASSRSRFDEASFATGSPPEPTEQTSLVATRVGHQEPAAHGAQVNAR